MDGEESLLGAINEEDEFESMEDVDMVDVEEGEIVVEPRNDNKEGLLGKENGQHHPKKKKKKKNKRRKGPPMMGKPMDLDRFVRDTCRRLKEKKSYMVYTAVGCLGILAFRDLVNEVEAIETCGGQVTADGSRKRTGGGILWNIIKARQPAAHSEIMKKTREFEKQFRHPNTRLKLGPKRDPISSSDGHVHASANASADEALVEMSVMPGTEENESKPQEPRKSVYERIRVPVSYDDLFGEVPLDASQAQHSSA